MSLSHSAKRAVTLIVMDILIVAELTYAFSKCFTTTADFSETFLTTYVPVFLPTVIVAFVVLWRIKRLEARDMAAAETAAQPAVDV
jgi:hypothetical protein